jgi:hypothetical protein
LLGFRGKCAHEQEGMTCMVLHCKWSLLYTGIIIHFVIVVANNARIIYMKNRGLLVTMKEFDFAQILMKVFEDAFEFDFA